MPRQGNTVESCIIVRWTAAEGDRVEADKAVCEVETDKASFEVPPGASGFLLKILHPEGDDVSVLAPIAVIGELGEDWQAALGGASPAPQAAQAADPIPTAVSPVPQAVQATSSVLSVAVSPRARARAAVEAIDVSTLAGTGPGGRVIERDVAAAAEARPPLTAAAKAALRSGAAAPAKGTALGGRAGVGDLGPAQKAAPEAVRPSGADIGDFPGPVHETPLKGIRKLISERMLASLASTAQLTFNGSADARQLQALRARFKASDPALGLSEVTIGDLALYAVSRVLPRFPNANSTLEDGILRSYDRVHLALAVDTPRGLMVPVIKNADLLSLREISAEAKRLAAACQAGSISPDDLSGGTFTVSNLGAFGIESFTPVLNAPQVAILGVDAIVPRAAVGPGGAVVIEPRIGLSITVDHQIVDGAPAARLLKAFADAIADIDLLLIGG
jgi:pyruvate dehydrogenase E2 component (dihydrolipoamide acetyltransferase)